MPWGLLWARAFTAKRTAAAQASAKSSGAAARAAWKARCAHDSHALLLLPVAGNVESGLGGPGGRGGGGRGDKESGMVRGETRRGSSD